MMTSFELRRHLRDRHGLNAAFCTYERMGDLHTALHRDDGGDHDHRTRPITTQTTDGHGYFDGTVA